MGLSARSHAGYRSVVEQAIEQGRDPEKFLVTGAAGALGAWTVKALVDEGVEVTAVCPTAQDRRLRLIVGERLTEVTRIDADVLAGDALVDAMAGVTHVVHTDSIDEDPTADSGAQRATREYAHLVSLDALLGAAHANGVRGVAYESSMSVYAVDGVDVDVDQRVRPEGFDGCIALARELLAGTWSSRHGLATVAVRIGFTYGPGADVGPNGTLAIASAAAIDNRPHALTVDGVADLQFVGDVGAAMCRAARSASGARAVNVVGEVGSIADVVEILSACTGAADLSIGPDAAAWSMALAHRNGDGVATLPTTLVDGLRATVEAVRWAPRDFASAQRPIPD
jgi:UDP-glucose 4-epimerase